MTRNLTIATLLVALASGSASADTLREALSTTYRANPTLNAQRENLKATDAGVAISRSAGRPTVTGTAGLTRDISRSGRFEVGTGKGPFLTAGTDLNVPLYQGGTVRNDIKASKKRVEAGRATLRAVEGDVFTEAVAAYMDVIRDRATVELNTNNVRVLETNLEATRDRFEIGDVTRTDVAQSEARLALGPIAPVSRPGPGDRQRAKLSPRDWPAARPAPAASPAAAFPSDCRTSGAGCARQQSRPDRGHAPGRGRPL